MSEHTGLRSRHFLSLLIRYSIIAFAGGFVTFFVLWAYYDPHRLIIFIAGGITGFGSGLLLLNLRNGTWDRFSHRLIHS